MNSCTQENTCICLTLWKLKCYCMHIHYNKQVYIFIYDLHVFDSRCWSHGCPVLEQWLCSAGVTLRRYPMSEEKEKPSKMVGRVKSHLELNPIHATDAQRAQTHLVHIRRPHRDWDGTVFECLLRRWWSAEDPSGLLRSAVDGLRGRDSGCSRPGYGISSLEGGHY